MGRRARQDQHNGPRHQLGRCLEREHGGKREGRRAQRRHRHGARERERERDAPEGQKLTCSSSAACSSAAKCICSSGLHTSLHSNCNVTDRSILMAVQGTAHVHCCRLPLIAVPSSPRLTRTTYGFLKQQHLLWD